MPNRFFRFVDLVLGKQQVLHALDRHPAWLRKQPVNQRQGGDFHFRTEKCRARPAVFNAQAKYKGVVKAPRHPFEYLFLVYSATAPGSGETFFQPLNRTKFRRDRCGLWLPWWRYRRPLLRRNLLTLWRGFLSESPFCEEYWCSLSL